MSKQRARWQRVPSARARVIAPFLLGMVGVLGWQLVAMSGAVPRTLLPSPLAVLIRLVHDIRAVDLLTRTLVTLTAALLGCLVACLVALPAAYLIAHRRLVEAAVSPFLAASQAIPAVALAPLLVIWLGYGLAPIVLLCSLIVFFPLLLAGVLGLRSINPDLIQAAQLDGAHGWSMAWLVEWPLARKAVLTGLRTGFTLSITGAVVGEYVMGGQGLGMVVQVQSASADTTGLFATITVLCLLAITVYLSLLAIEAGTDPLRPLPVPVKEELA